ncbi:glycoside hydrolase family 26 protein [Sporosarcina siberiensis]|uniref:Glycoside hydrolase family 26 protein n=1 Tax=Sporosarcina siberiensis TaxID=1365606 RepID=A0ABW4SII3_9BACL
MRTFKKIIGIVAVLLLVFGGLALLKLWPSKTNNETSGIVSKDEAGRKYSMDVVYDGNHHKINYPVFYKDDHIYISLNDLQNIVDMDTKEDGKKVTISYKDNVLRYEGAVIQNSNAKENEVDKYIIKDEIIFIPDRHIEKFLGIEVGYFMDEKTNTISLKSPLEQQKENYDQEIGTTLFLHKDNVPLEKNEPRKGLYLGGYVLQDEYIDLSMNKFNEIANKDHATYFKYVGYGIPFPKEWVDEVIAVGGFPQIAWEPNNGLEKVQDDEYLRQFARDAKEANVPVLLRYASEMNGNWTAYSDNPELYIEKWKLVHRVMQEDAPNVMMLWNVFTIPEQTINDFYPGDEYVDYVGLNIYNVVYHNDELVEPSHFEDPLRLLDYVYNTYSHKKPIVIGEFGATNYNVTDGLYHVDFAIEKISRMYKHLPHLYPRVKNIYYFDVNNLVNAPEGRKINNYAVTENKRISEAYVNYIAQEEYLSGLVQDTSEKEVFSYRDFLFYYEGELFVDTQFVSDYLQMDVKDNGAKSYKITYNGQTHQVQKESLNIDKAAFFEKREINGVLLNELLEKFQLKYEVDNNDIHIFYN